MPSAAELVATTASEFDRVPAGSEVSTSYDYELSALLVRFLLTDDHLTARFHAFLAKLSHGGRWSPDLLWQVLETPPETLDQELKAWILEL